MKIAVLYSTVSVLILKCPFLMISKYVMQIAWTTNVKIIGHLVNKKEGRRRKVPLHVFMVLPSICILWMPKTDFS
jgi:hypothetical protein